MNPETEKGLKSGVLDRVIDAVHDEGKQILLISANLPYDAACYEEADAVLLSCPTARLRCRRFRRERMPVP